MIIDKPDPATSESSLPAAKEKKVTFAPDAKPEAPSGSSATSTKEDNKEKKIDGVIGQLEVHRSGMIKLRLSNGTLLDVSLFDIRCLCKLLSKKWDKRLPPPHNLHFFSRLYISTRKRRNFVCWAKLTDDL